MIQDKQKNSQVLVKKILRRDLHKVLPASSSDTNINMHSVTSIKVSGFSKKIP